MGVTSCIQLTIRLPGQEDQLRRRSLRYLSKPKHPKQCNSADLVCCQSLASWSHRQLGDHGLRLGSATVLATATATVYRWIEAAQRSHCPHARRPSTVAVRRNGQLLRKTQDASNSTTAPASTLLPT